MTIWQFLSLPSTTKKNSLLPVEFLVRSHQAPYHQIFIKHKDEDQEKHWNWIHAYLIIILDKDIVFEWIPLQKKVQSFWYTNITTPFLLKHCIAYNMNTLFAIGNNIPILLFCSDNFQIFTNTFCRQLVNDQCVHVYGQKKNFSKFEIMSGYTCV